MLLYQPSALLRAPLGVWSAVSWSRPGQEQSGYQDVSDQFRVECRDKVRRELTQEVYDSRLMFMRPLIVEEARRRFGPDVIVKSLADLKYTDEVQEEEEEEDGDIWENILVIGTLYKMAEKDAFYMAELGKELEVRLEPQPRLYTCEQNTLMLEDESRRIKLTGFCLDPMELVTGVVVGAWGMKEDGKDEFWVEDLVYARVMSPHEEAGGWKEELEVCVMSGLELGTEECEWLSSAQLAADWMLGSVSSPGEQRHLVRVERLIIAGDSIGTNPSTMEDWFRKQYRTFTSMTVAESGARQLDDLLVQLVAGLNVDLMPGRQDPVSGRMPQQPLHKVSDCNVVSV